METGISFGSEPTAPARDLAEENDLSAKMPEKTRELVQPFTAFLAQVKATTVRTKIGKDE